MAPRNNDSESSHAGRDTESSDGSEHDDDMSDASFYRVMIANHLKELRLKAERHLDKRGIDRDIHQVDAI